MAYVAEPPRDAGGSLGPRGAVPSVGQGERGRTGPDLNAVLQDFGLRFVFSFGQGVAGKQADQNEKQNENETKNTV